MYILIEFALLISTLKSKSKNWLYRSSGKHHKDIIYIYRCIYKSHEPRAVRCGRHRCITRSTKALEVGILVAFDIQRLSSDMFRLIWAIESRHVGQIRFDPTSISIGSFFLVGRKFGASFLPKASGCGSSLFSELPLVRHGALFLPVGEIEGCRGCHEEMKT